MNLVLRAFRLVLNFVVVDVAVLVVFGVVLRVFDVLEVVELDAPLDLVTREEFEQSDEFDVEEDNDVIELFNKLVVCCCGNLFAFRLRAGGVVAMTLRLVSRHVFLSVGVTIMSFELKRKNCVDGPRNCSIKFGFIFSVAFTLLCVFLRVLLSRNKKKEQI